MGSFVHDGHTLVYELRGRKPGAQERPVVLLHGLLFSRMHHYPLADALAERGNRVILIDLLGHGDSDQPGHARHYRMEFFSQQVLALMDHLDVGEAVVGGTSLGANVTLEVAAAAPERCRGLFVEMPVLERAAPAAALVFVPLAIGYAQASRPLARVASLLRKAPRGVGLWPDVFLQLFARDPLPSAAVLHGLLTGRIAPHPDERVKIDKPALVIGHQRDLLHPFSDAEALHRELPNSQLIQAKSFFELRFAPNRLSDALGDFLDEVWST